MKHYLKSVITSLLCLVLLAGCGVINDRKTQELNRLLKAGNDALLAKQYETAIKYYDMGLSLEPGEAIFLNNKAIAFRMRGTDKYNAAIKLTDAKARTVGREAAREDFQKADLLTTEAVSRVKSIPAIPLLDYSFEKERANVFLSRADTLRIIATAYDRARAREALEAIHQYLQIETDPEKKLKVQLDAGKMLVETSNAELAINEYKKILAAYPDNPEALLGIGMALAQTGDKTKFQEAKQYLQRFIEQAPKDHPQISLAKEILNSPM